MTHTYQEHLQKLMKNPEFKKEYDALETEYQLISQMIELRNKYNITQAELAKRIGTTQSNISRLESGNYNPSVEFLNRVAGAFGKKVDIRFR